MLQVENKIWQWGFGTLALVAGLLALVFILWPYQALVPVFQQFNAESSWLRNQHHFALASRHYTLLKGFFMALTLLSLGLVAIFRNKAEPLTFRTFIPTETLRFFARKLQTQWRRLPLVEKQLFGLFFGLLLGVRLYFLSIFWVSIDEVSTFTAFINRGLPGILFYYPLPNNHIFYNLLCLPFAHFLAETTLVLKLPALLISVVSTGLLYVALRSVFSFPVVFLGVFGSGFSTLALYFSVHGRGYALQFLCAGLLALAFLKLAERKEPHYWLVVLFAAIAGFLTVPVFLYPFLACFFFGAAAFFYSGNRARLKALLVVAFFAGMATVLLYLPLLIISGPQLLFANGYVVPLPREVFWQKFPFYLNYMQGVILGQETIGFYMWLAALGVLVSGLLWLPARRVLSEIGLSRLRIFWLLSGSVVPWVLLAVQGVLPPERVWLFKAFPDFLLLAGGGLAAARLLRFSPKAILASVLLMLTVYGTYETHKLKRSVQGNSILDEPMPTMLAAIRQAKPQLIFTTEGYYTSFLYYEFARHRLPLRIHEGRPQRNNAYDFVIMAQPEPFPPQLERRQYAFFHKDKFVQIFIRKKN